MPPPAPGAPTRRRPEAPPEGFPLSPTGAGFGPAGGDDVLVDDVLDAGDGVLVDADVLDEDADELETAVVGARDLAELEVGRGVGVDVVANAAKVFLLMKWPSVTCVGMGLPAFFPRCTSV